MRRFWGRAQKAVFENPLPVIITAGILVRILVVDTVAVNYDAGLYLYDAEQILAGRTPIVDYPTRSPLFHYLLALPLALGVDPIITARAFMIVISVSLGGAVYVAGARLHSKRAGWIAATLFLFSPVTLVWGLWLKTEQAASLVALVAIVLLLSKIRDHHLSRRILVGAGGLLGAAFLIRRIVIVHLVLVGVILIYYRWRHAPRPIRTTLSEALTIYSGAIIALAVGYGILAWPSFGMFPEIVRQHFVALFTGGSGTGVAWVDLPSSGPPSATDDAGLFRPLRPPYLDRSVTVAVQTVAIGLPMIVPLAVVTFALANRLGDHLPVDVADYAGVVLGLVAFAWFLKLRTLFPFPRSALLLIGVLCGISLLWYLPTPEFDRIWTVNQGAMAFVAIGVAGAYLARDRVVFITYAQDIFPYLAVIAGAALAELSITEFHRYAIRGGVLILLVFAAVGMLFAVPFFPAQPGSIPDGETPVTLQIAPSEAREAGNELRARTKPGEAVFTTQPLYAVAADRPVVANFSRKYWILKRRPDAAISGRIRAQISDEITQRKVPYALSEVRTRIIMRRNPQLERTIDAQFCQTTTSRTFQKVGVRVRERCQPD